MKTEMRTPKNMTLNFYFAESPYKEWTERFMDVDSVQKEIMKALKFYLLRYFCIW